MLFSLLADGYKYNRACKTPNFIVERYQKTLKYWISLLSLSNHVSLIDYEQWLKDNNNEKWVIDRENKFLEIYHTLSYQFDKYFNSNNINNLKSCLLNEIGYQLAYTFSSILTSVNYNSLFSNNYDSIYKEKYLQNFYISYLSSLNLDLSDIKYSYLFSRRLIGEYNSKSIDIVKAMREEAWEAAKRYVSISLTDRYLNTIFSIIPNCLKLTIHGKKGEINFISTTQQDLSITAQHSVAGLDLTNNSIHFKYRIEREYNKEKRIFIEENSSISFNPLNDIAKSYQPIFYSR
ncbi:MULTISPECIES: hypothetical protein [unclassified Pasteurella]|uniref:hypothetical protein n=1 Tax=unclassified Pasteurella TaxID=2621516 RepID=UPI001073B348|nr:hypothetical protein [Pasteurella sp. 19428wF3_WM03]TFU49804.1 hypothetical protein E4T92_10145 [Pasteurella sp. WM03]